MIIIEITESGRSLEQKLRTLDEVAMHIKLGVKALTMRDQYGTTLASVYPCPDDECAPLDPANEDIVVHDR